MKFVFSVSGFVFFFFLFFFFPMRKNKSYQFVLELVIFNIFIFKHVALHEIEKTVHCEED